MNYDLYKHLLRENTSTQRMIHSLKTLAGAEISELIQPLSAKRQEQLILIFAAQLYESTDECFACLGKLPEVEFCEQCQGKGRVSKDHTIKRLMRELDALERRLEKSILVDAVVAPV